MPDDDLRRLLGEIQRRGAIGPVDLDDAIHHAADFVLALPDGPLSVIDLGSGGGLPGLVIAARRPDVALLLVERRAKRADLLRYAVRALGVADHVVVTETDAARLGSTLTGPADVVTARSFGAPQVLMPIAASLVRSGGMLVVSEPPDRQSRWDVAELLTWGFDELDHVGGVRRLLRH
jgi:16S rRNA (guanine527-N7)-methyltransferase